MNATVECPPNLDLLLDVGVKLSVELGSCRMPVRDVLQLAAGSIVQLDKLADAPVELYVNQKLVAHGEIVVVDDHYGIKITQMLGTPAA
jgi:flagellar motor switch protein FliN